MKTILYVDDENVNTLFFKLNFQNEYNVLLASSGQEGLEMIEESEDIAAVISDMRMPGMDGLEFIRTIKEKDSKRPCYILSGYDITPEIQEALNNKILDKYFQKPMNIVLIKEELKKVLE